MSEQNKALGRRMIEAVWNDQDYAVVDAHIPSDFIAHSSPDDIHGPEGYKQFFSMIHQAFPDIHFTVEDVIAEADQVVMRWRVRGTHRGEFMGIPATGRKVAMTGMTIGRMAGNKVIEGWTNWDLFALMQQLGVLPMPDHAG